MRELSQKQRLLVLALYVSALLVVCRVLFGSWMPPTTAKGVWFYASLADLLLGTLLLSPYFTKPVDAVSNGAAALLVVPVIAGTVWGLGQPWISWALKALTAYFFIIVLTGAMAMALRDSQSQRGKRAAVSMFVISTNLGRAPLVFSVLFFFALLAFHRSSMREFATLTLLWAIIVPLRVLENSVQIGRRIRSEWRTSKVLESIGEPHARKEPNLMLLKKTGTTDPQYGHVVVLRESDSMCYAMVIDELQLAGESWIRSIAISGKLDAQTYNGVDAATKLCPTALLDGFLAQSCLDTAFCDSLVYKHRSDLIGLVAPNTDISTLQFEIVRTDRAFCEGQLVQTQIGGKSVLYQVINGITQEEILSQKNTYGYARAEAKKIGMWSAAKGRFEHVGWIPSLNEPVFLVQAQAAPDVREAVGFFPGTAFPVSLDVDKLVTHNCAILGILGAGKTYLALELVERMILEGIKVIALDLTNQYATELQPYYDEAGEQANLDQLKAVGPPGKTNVSMNVAEGGSVQAFQNELRQQLTAFLGAQDQLVRIYNPTVFEVWRQDSRQFQGQAAMAQLTPTEITRLITEMALELSQATVTDKARLCVVFEEAHSLIPEWNAVVSEGDKSATNATAKAILQGRKYGLGCLVVTQRTANVTKTILNQCNTVFALRVFDATGMEFLRNYIGDDYAGVLSTLEDRHAVVFGRASSCSEPVLVRLNDRDTFVRLNRALPNTANP